MMQNQELKRQAQDQLEKSSQGKKLSLCYAGAICGVSVIFMALDLLISSQIPQTGGLSTIGLRSFLSALSSILPIISFVLSMCLGFGYLGGMLRISRGQYASPNALRTGFERFWPLLRLTMLKGLILAGLSIGATYLATTIYTLSPLSDSLLETLQPVLSGGSILNEGTGAVGAVLDAGVMDAVYDAMLPISVIFLIIMAVFVVPILYRLRLTDYVLLDHPEAGAMYAIRQSKLMMRNNRMAMFKLDLSFWWFYGLIILSTLLSYGIVLLGLIGVTLPISDNFASVLFFLLSTAADFAVIYFFRAKPEVTYALAYNSLKPPETNQGAVLGNIFQM